MDGLFCIFKDREVVFSNKEVPQLLYNVLSGLDDIGKQLFSERLRVIKADPFVIGVTFEDEFTIVATASSEDELSERMLRHQETIDRILSST